MDQLVNKLLSRTKTTSQKWSLLALVLVDSLSWSRAGPEVLGLGLIILGWTTFPYLLGRTKTKTSSEMVTLVLALGLCVNNLGLGLGFEHILPPPLGWDQDRDSLPKWWLCCPQSPNWRPPLLSSHPQLPDLGRLSHFIEIFKTNKFI